MGSYRKYPNSGAKAACNYANAGHCVPGARPIPFMYVTRPLTVEEIYSAVCDLFELKARLWVITQHPDFGRVDMRAQLLDAGCVHVPSDPAEQPTSAKYWSQRMADVIMATIDEHRDDPAWQKLLPPSWLERVLAAGRSCDG